MPSAESVGRMGCGGSTPVAPAEELPPCRWKYMISYRQAEAKEEAIKLAYELTGDKNEVWLDVNMDDQSEDAMREAVRDSEVFVCMLTPSYLESSYCSKELNWARVFEKPIVSVYPSQFSVGQILKAAPAELAWIASYDSKKIDISCLMS